LTANDRSMKPQINKESHVHDINHNVKITGLITVGVPVSDQDRAVEFYIDTLGFEKRRDAPFGEGRWIEVAPPESATSIALVAERDGGRIGVDTGIRLACRHAEADHEALLAAGVDADSEIMRMGDLVPPMFSFRDPDGNRLVVVEQPRLEERL
jgi:catechol 2,3-dioxygenase-like lactoylglutathione lyase family enzyme